MKNFRNILVLALLIIHCSLLTGQQHYIQLKFNEPMDRETLFDVNNYTLFDSNLRETQINRIGVAEGDTIVILYTKFLAYKSGYTVRVQNVKDKAGNYINENNSAWLYFDGYDVKQHRPYLIIKK